LSLDRRVIGAYAVIEAQVTEKFQAGVAVRSEHYSDFGDTTNGKLSLRYDFTPQIAARASASTGYRAPSLVQSECRRSACRWWNNRQAAQPGRVQQRTLPRHSPEAALLPARR
jgi:iron complex outermembrane receptor protein